jgi:sugar O-acyltransferase (sialic acid O-acetyltransferase NeuD family)
MEKLIIFGNGEFAEIAHFYFSRYSNYEIEAFTINKEYIKQTQFLGKAIIPFENIEKHFSPQYHKMFIAVGYNRINTIRKDKYIEAKNKGYQLVSFISKNAFIADNVTIGDNCFIFEDNTIQPFVKIGNNCFLWSGNHIGHHSTIQDHCFIASHVVISGGCEIGEGTFIGVNATLRDHIKIGKYNVIGAGALILGDTEDYKVYMASPTEASKVPSNRLRRI